MVANRARSGLVWAVAFLLVFGLAAIACGAERVAAVIDGDTVALASGREVRLVGIQAPKLPLGRKGFSAWPLAEEAKAALEDLTLAQDVILTHGGAREDRHGRLLAHLHRAGDRVWVQGSLLRHGLARVYTFDDNRALAAELYAEERAARAERRGIWAHPFYRIRGVEELAPDLDTFQVIEGRVRRSANVRGRVYLNFGRDWGTDFTVTIAADALRLFRDAKLDPLALEGRVIRVRGWLKSQGGPLIEATHPEPIEVLVR